MPEYFNPETQERYLVVFSEEEASKKWNSIADGYNQWHELCLEEKLNLMKVVASTKVPAKREYNPRNDYDADLVDRSFELAQKFIDRAKQEK